MDTDQLQVGDLVLVTPPDTPEYMASVTTPVIFEFVGSIVEIHEAEGTVDIEDGDGVTFDGVPMGCLSPDPDD